MVTDSAANGLLPTLRLSNTLPITLYLLFSSGVLAVIAYVSLDPVAVVSYQRDIWHHLSVYRELIAAPFDAQNPHVATDDPSRSYSPWTMSVAILARLFGLDEFGAITLSAVGSTFAILLGIYLFARRYWQSYWAPILLGVVFLSTWYIQIGHTGYHTVATFLYSASYPFAIVLGVGFISWWIALGALQAKGALWLHGALLFVLAYFMFVTHQLQGLFAIGGTGAFLLFACDAQLKRRLFLILALLAGLLATKTWWYFDPIAYVLDPEVRRGHSAVRYLKFSFEDFPAIIKTLGIALFGVTGFVCSQSRRLRIELLLPFLVLVAGFIGLVALGNWVSVRVLPFIALFLQLGLVCYLLDRRKGIHGTVVRFLVLLAIGYGVFVNPTDAWRDYTRARTFLETGQINHLPDSWSRDILAASDFAESLVPPGSVAIAHLQTAFPMEATSLNVVAIPRLFSEVPDMLERQAANRKFFSAEAEAEIRCAILERYHVSLIVWRDVWLDPEIAAELETFGARQVHGDLSFIASGAEGFEGCGS